MKIMVESVKLSFGCKAEDMENELFSMYPELNGILESDSISYQLNNPSISGDKYRVEYFFTMNVLSLEEAINTLFEKTNKDIVIYSAKRIMDSPTNNLYEEYKKKFKTDYILNIYDDYIE